MNKRSLAMIVILMAFGLILYSSYKVLTPDSSQPIITEPMKNLTFPANHFSLKLLQQLSNTNQDKNVFFSPISVMSAMSLAENGARGDTRYELRKLLSLTAFEESESNRSFHDFFANANRDGKAYLLNIANALWVDNGFKLSNSFTVSASDSFDAKISNVDFKGQSEESRKTINSWVSDKTKGKIPELFSQGSITKDTRLAITNAVYFKADWLNAFDKKMTRQSEFTTSSGVVKQVDMMTLVHSDKSKLNYYEDTNVQVVELPYKGKDLSMQIILPKSGVKLDSYIKTLTPDILNGYIAKMSQEEVSVELPKMKFETTYDLIPSFKQLGVKLAFDSGQADFSGIDGEKGLYITVIVHKAFVEVNEEGTEAAAATGIGFTRTSIEEPKYKIFQVNRPFIFIIKDTATGIQLFVGKVIDPEV